MESHPQAEWVYRAKDLAGGVFVGRQHDMEQRTIPHESAGEIIFSSSTGHSIKSAASLDECLSQRH
jgi:hypothetical protein